MPTKKQRDELAEFIESLRPVKVGRDGYSATHRHRDFHAVFSTDQGRRVLSQIMDYCEGIPLGEDQMNDSGRLAFVMGRRRVGLWITSMMVPPRTEPKGE